MYCRATACDGLSTFNQKAVVRGIAVAKQLSDAAGSGIRSQGKTAEESDQNLASPHPATSEDTMPVS
jgi:hypothetical protein